MEELKILVEMVAALPTMAVWVLVGFFAYKVIIVGSIYGLIRFIVERFYLWKTTPVTKLTRHEVEVLLDGLVISDSKEALLNQLRRLIGQGMRLNTGYVHDTSVEWLRDAIDDKIAKEQAERIKKQAA